MAEKIAFENGRISNFEGLVTLTLDPVILHTVVHHSSTSTYKPNFIAIEEHLCGRMDVRTYKYARTDGHLRPALLDWRDLKNPNFSGAPPHTPPLRHHVYLLNFMSSTLRPKTAQNTCRIGRWIGISSSRHCTVFHATAIARHCDPCAHSHATGAEMLSGVREPSWTTSPAHLYLNITHTCTPRHFKSHYPRTAGVWKIFIYSVAEVYK